MVNAIIKEIHSRKSYLNEIIKTIYLGGGTPSLLSDTEIRKVLDSIYQNFNVDPKAEITLEANPEDLTLEKALSFFNVGINRLSIGIQTFENEKLKWMNRAHSSSESISAYENARKAGFDNISLDLIYARPDENSSTWEKDLEKIIALNPEHISLYGLTIEAKTVFGKWEKDKKLIQVPEERAAEQYLFAMAYLAKYGYNQYEVSNFCKNGFESKHNSSYWAGTYYLGVGPGAHSFNGDSRHINIRNNPKYIELIRDDVPHWEEEKLSQIQKLNEQILTQLRTSKGLNLEEISQHNQVDFMQDHDGFIKDLIHKNLAIVEGGQMKLLPNGFLIADEIALRLFFDE